MSGNAGSKAVTATGTNVKSTDAKSIDLSVMTEGDKDMDTGADIMVMVDIRVMDANVTATTAMSMSSTERVRPLARRRPRKRSSYGHAATSATPGMLFYGVPETCK